MKRWICMLLVLVIVFSLSGCGSDGDTQSMEQEEVPQEVSASTYRAMLAEMIAELAPNRWTTLTAR